MDTQKLWQEVLEKARPQVSLANYRGWLTKTIAHSINDANLVVLVPSAFVAEQLKTRYFSLICQILEETTGDKVTVVFKIDPARFTNLKEAPEGEDLFVTSPPANSSTYGLNPKYLLENFVVGLSNNVAYAAAQAVTQNPGLSYNPLLVWGGTGVGKTHLMIGVGNAIFKKTPASKILYASSEKFTNDYVQAIQERSMSNFKIKYRSCDLLLIDDVQFFAGREGTQEEFFHTFNELQTKNCQIILTSDRPPSEIVKLEDRLKSRFQGGLMVDIQLPDYDTRVAILRAKCKERGEYLPEVCLNTIASSLQTNARELEGKLIQILQFLKINPPPDGPTPEVISHLLGQSTGQPLQFSYKDVLTSICNYFNIKQSELTGPKRNKGLVFPRHLAMFILSEDLKLTVARIGELLGGRDHTTVMHGRDRIKKLVGQDREVQRIFIEVKQQLF